MDFTGVAMENVARPEDKAVRAAFKTCGGLARDVTMGMQRERREVR
jgi:hypothetical protein